MDAEAPKTFSFKVKGRVVKTPAPVAINALARVLDREIDYDGFRVAMGLDGTSDFVVEYAISRLVDVLAGLTLETPLWPGTSYLNGESMYADLERLPRGTVMAAHRYLTAVQNDLIDRVGAEAAKAWRLGHVLKMLEATWLCMHTRACPNCKTVYQPEARFCARCGCAISFPAQTAREELTDARSIPACEEGE